MSTQSQPFLLTQCDREMQRLETLRPEDLEKVSAGSGPGTINGFTLCYDEENGLQTDAGDLND